VGAFNWIVIDDVCATCGRLAKIRCQTHVASSYGGDEDGRFFDEEYRLGERMRWWEPGHPKFVEWRHDGRIDPVDDPLLDEEACYSHCLLCESDDLVVVVRFRDLTPTEVLGISREKEG